MTSSHTFNFGGTITTPGVVTIPAITGYTYCQVTHASVRSTIPQTDIAHSFARLRVNYANPSLTILQTVAPVDSIVSTYTNPAPAPGERHLAAAALLSSPNPPAQYWVKDNIYEWDAVGIAWLRTIPQPGMSVFVTGGLVFPGETLVYGELSPPSWIPRVITMTYDASSFFGANGVAEFNLMKMPDIPPVGNPTLGYEVRLYAQTTFTGSMTIRYS